MGTEPHVSHSSIYLDTTNQCVWQDGQSIALTPKAFLVLRYLAERPGQLITKEELLDAAWPGIYVSDAALKVCIRRLRQALGDLSHPPHYIETVHWRGYRLLAPIPTLTTSGQSSAFKVHNEKEPRNGHTETHSIPPLSLLTIPLDSMLNASNGQSPLSRLVGREAELDKLTQCFSLATQGNRYTVFLTGAPGIGKTAVIEAFLTRIGKQSQVRIAQGQCIEHYGAGEPYLPILEAFTRLCRTPQAERIISILQQHAPMWLAQMPSLLSPEERKRLRREVHGSSREHMLREMAEAVEVLTTDTPLILVLEDLHWSDYATLDLLSFLARRKESARVLLLGTYRAEELAPQGHPLKNIKHDLHAHRQGEEVQLLPLTLHAIDAFLADRFPNHTFPSSLTVMLRQRTGGHPLFLTNMVDHLVLRGFITRRNVEWGLQSPLTDLHTETPADIRQIIEAQIDRLTPDERLVLEVASVAGMEFSAAAVAAVLDKETVQIESYCEELARRGQFLRAQGAGEWPDGTVAARYEFMHSLYQQLWYERVTAGRRVQLHLRLGERGERAYQEHAPEIAAELALHFERGRDLVRSLRYRQYAAENAMRRFGYQEALTHLTQGLALLSTQPASPERDRQEIVLQNALGAATMAIQGYAAPAVEQAYARAYTLCQQVAATSHIASTLRGLWAFHLSRAELQTAHILAEQLFHIAQQEQSQSLQLEAERELGQTLYFLGELPEAHQYLVQSFKRYNLHTHACHAVLYGQDPGVVCLAQDARALCLMGYPNQALQQLEAAIVLGKEVAHPYSLALAQYHATVVHHARRDWRRTQTMAEATIALATEHTFPYWLSLAQVLKGWTLAMQGQPEAGIQFMQQGLTDYQKTGATLNHPYSLALLAEAYGVSGKIMDGVSLLQEAQQLAKLNKGYFYQAEMFRLQGELTLQQLQTPVSEFPALPNISAEAQAEMSFLKAIALARQQNAKLLELRAVMSLSRLWRSQGRIKEAQQQLAHLYAWFTEGFDSVDLQEARALLGELS